MGVSSANTPTWLSVPLPKPAHTFSSLERKLLLTVNTKYTETRHMDFVDSSRLYARTEGVSMTWTMERTFLPHLEPCGTHKVQSTVLLGNS